MNKVPAKLVTHRLYLCQACDGPKACYEAAASQCSLAAQGFSFKTATETHIA